MDIRIIELGLVGRETRGNENPSAFLETDPKTENREILDDLAA